MSKEKPMKPEKTMLDRHEQITRIFSLYTQIETSDGVPINLLTMPHRFRKKIEHLSAKEQEALTRTYSRITKLKQHLGVVKRKLNQQGVDVNERLLEVKKAYILELFGAYYNIEEIHKKVIEHTGVNVEIASIRKFSVKYRLEIEKLQSDYDKNIGTIGITKKRSRLEQIDYLLRRMRQEFDSSQGKSMIPYSREIRELLEQARKEVEGNKLQIDVNGNININATIEQTLSVEQLYANLNFDQLIIAMMAHQQNVNPLLMHYRMLNSYYHKHIGFNQNHFSMNDDIIYPSKLITGWDDVKEKVRQKESEEKTLQEKFDKYIEDYVDKPGEKHNIKGQLKEKVREGRLELERAKRDLEPSKKDVQSIIDKIKKKQAENKK